MKLLRLSASSGSIRDDAYATQGDAKQDIFDYIEMFYNPKRRHGFNNKLSPVNYEKQYFKRLASDW